MCENWSNWHAVGSDVIPPMATKVWTPHLLAVQQVSGKFEPIVDWSLSSNAAMECFGGRAPENIMKLKLEPKSVMIHWFNCMGLTNDISNWWQAVEDSVSDRPAMAQIHNTKRNSNASLKSNGSRYSCRSKKMRKMLSKSPITLRSKLY